ncbi:MAG: AIR synthase family protein [Gammaproteobacteria bacterium]|nr:AIR synthase family protein [Gammaproteobacteria bacterium]
MDKVKSLLPGKLPNDVLKDLLARFATDDPRVIVGPGVGSDAALIDMGGSYLVAKTDPVTFATDRIGWYAVHVNANDIACCGGDPRWFLATLLLPEQGTTVELVEDIMSQIANACADVGASLCGGHTEITRGLDRPLVVGLMLGEVAPTDALSTANAQVGDVLILTKGIAIEGTSILAREFSECLGAVDADVVESARAFLDDPGISVLRDARIARHAGGVHALHDPTEGGISQALYELASAAEVGVAVRFDDIVVLEECRAICDVLDIDPLGLIASGALLVAAAADRAGAVVVALEAEGIAARPIGEVVHASEGVTLRRGGSTEPLAVFARDELASVLARIS